MASEAQLKANRLNSKSSTGPKSGNGKKITRGNSLKHGLAGDGRVLDPCDQLVLDRRYPEFLLDLAPRNRQERLLVHRLAVASVQMDSATRQIHVNQIDNIREAGRRWSIDRETEVEALVANLDADPSGTIRKLHRSTHGCQWMLDRWGELMLSLRSCGSWSEGESLLAHRMTGVSLELIREDENFDHVTLLDSEVERLEALDDELWETFDGPHYANAEARAYWDRSAHGELVRRYEKAAERLFFRTLTELRQSKREPLGATSPSSSARQPDVYASLKAIGLPIPPAKPSPVPPPAPVVPPATAPQNTAVAASAAPSNGQQRNEANPGFRSVSPLSVTARVADAAANPAVAEAKPAPATSNVVDPRRKRQEQARKARQAAKAARKKQRARR